MKSLIFRLIAVFFFVTFASSAQSGDWTGGFIGLHGGYAWQDATLLFDSGGNSSPSEVDLDDWIVGGQGGYLFQTGNFVFGIVGDYTIGRDDDLVNDADRANIPLVSCCRDSIRVDTDYLASVRGTLGYAFGNVLVFGTVGIGFTEYELRVNSPGSVAHSLGNDVADFGKIETDEQGVVYGGGVQIKVADGLSVGLEWLHYDVGKTINIPDDDDPPFIPDADDGDFLKFDDVDVVRASINIHFVRPRESVPLK